MLGIPEQVRDRFVVNPKSKTGLSYKETGKDAGSLNSRGYYTVQYKRKKYQVHRIVWFLWYRRQPGDLVIDHKDGNKTNNNIENLRLCTSQLNNCRPKRKGTRSEYKGVNKLKTYSRERFQAYIMHEGKQKHLGVYSSELEAARAYDCAAVELFGEFAKTNF